MDVTGTLKFVGESQQVSDKFKKREFVLTEHSSQYPQHVAFQLTQDKCGLIDSYKVGDEIKVYFNLRGRLWTSPQGEDKYFNTLEAWRLETAAAPQSATEAYHAKSAAEQTQATPDDGKELPF